MYCAFISIVISVITFHYHGVHFKCPSENRWCGLQPRQLSWAVGWFCDWCLTVKTTYKIYSTVGCTCIFTLVCITRIVPWVMNSITIWRVLGFKSYSNLIEFLILYKFVTYILLCCTMIEKIIFLLHKYTLTEEIIQQWLSQILCAI